MKIVQRIFLSEVDSTHDWAARAGLFPPPGGALAIRAGRQLKGKGRQGKCFVSDTATGIWATLLLAWLDDPFFYNRALTLATYDALSARCSRRSLHIKWPNDIECEGKKICGILLHTLSSGKRKYIAAGFGVNITTTTQQLPLQLRSVATSLFCETGRLYHIETLYNEILTRFCDYCSVAVSQAHERYSARLRGVGEAVRIEEIQGEFRGVDSKGRALLKTAARTRAFSGGTLRFCNAPTTTSTAEYTP